MTQAEMEQVLENIDRRLTNVEQILPTLATKADLVDGIADAKRHASILNEALEGRFGLIAEDVLDLRSHVKNLKTDVGTIKTDVGAISLQLAALISRLERKGVI